MKPITVTTRLPRIRAITLWPFIFLAPSVVGDKCIMAHEMHHWTEQRRYWVIPWFIVYLVIGIFYIGRPMDRHPMEREGYRIQRECERSS